MGFIPSEGSVYLQTCNEVVEIKLIHVEDFSDVQYEIVIKTKLNCMIDRMKNI